MSSGDLLEGKSQVIAFDVTLTSNIDGGTAEGTNLWSITAFGSANADGSGTRQEVTSSMLSEEQSGTTLRAGTSATISGVSASWQLSDGPTCSQISHFCVEVSKGSNPDFALIGVPTSSVLVSCTPITCRGM